MSEILTSWLETSPSIRVALALVHFLWQGTLVAALVWLVTALLQGRSANVRYLAGLSGLMGMAICAVVTFFAVDVRPPTRLESRLWPSTAHVRGHSITNPAGASISDEAAGIAGNSDVIGEVDANRSDGVVANGAKRTDAFESTFASSDTLPANASLEGDATSDQGGKMDVVWRSTVSCIVSAYLLGVFVLLGRLLVGVCGGWNLRRQSEPVSDPALLSLLADRARALKVSISPALCCCKDVAVPTVVGVLRPTILLPMSLISGLSHDQLEAILTHELAHIRRYDHLVNIVQRVFEAFLFFHPAVWWVSRRIRIEREHCCDDIVLQFGAEPVHYAELLVEIAEHQQQSRPLRNVGLVAALQATSGRSQVSQRVRRMLGAPVTESFRLSRGGLATLLVCGIVLISFAVASQPTPEKNFVMPDGDKPVQDNQIAENEQRTEAMKSPRDVVAEFLKLIKDGSSKRAFDLTIPDSHAGWSRAFVELLQVNSIRPLHQVNDGEKAIVVSSVYRGDSRHDEVFTAVLQKKDGQWLIEKHSRLTPKEAFLMVSGFKTSTHVRFSLIPDELIGRWEINVCESTVMLKADGTGSRLSAGPAGPAADAVAQPVAWSVEDDKLTIKSQGREETLRVQIIDVGALQFVSVEDGSSQTWAASGKDPNVLPAQTIRLDGQRPFLNLVKGQRYAPPDGIRIEPPVFRNKLEPGKPNELQRWAGKNGVTLGMVKYNHKFYLQFFEQHAYPIHNPRRAAYYWNTRTASEIHEAYRKGGFGMLPFEAFFQIELEKENVPKIWDLPDLGLMRVSQFNGGDRPSVTLQLKLVKDEHADERGAKSEQPMSGPASERQDDATHDDSKTDDSE